MVKQTMLGRDGLPVDELNGKTHREIRLRTLAASEMSLRGNVRSVCPWCLYIGTLDRFTTLNADGTISKMVSCPECTQTMKETTLRKVDMGPVRYSEWFWDQIFSFKAHDRVSWDRLKKRVVEMGFEYEFWEAYRKMKAAKESAKSVS